MLDQPLASRDGGQVTLTAEIVEVFESRLRGALIRPSDSAYDEARQVYNAMHDRRPALIVQARDAADVTAAVGFARDEGLALAVRGGGHSVPGFGTCDGGLVLDLGAMTGVRVDPVKGRVRAEGGCTWADVDHATHGFGLATPGGVVSSTGIGGLSLGGGMGHLSRRCGLSCDNLLSADVVTAAGDLVTCDAETHPELFWALRGGGGNFGVVTSFQYRTHPVAEVLGGPTFFHMDGDVMRSYQAFIEQAPEELNAVFAIVLAPALPFVPEEWHGKPVMGVVTCWSGNEEQDDWVRGEIAGFGQVVGQMLWRMPYPVINTLFDELLPAGLKHYWKANVLKRFTEEAIAVHLEHGPKVPSLESGPFIFPINGACHRVGVGDSAFAHRAANFSLVIAGSWQDAADNEANIRWVRDYHAAIAPHCEAGGYINFMSGDDQARAPANYGANHRRLREIKAVYDPENLFRLNQNVEPAE
ncbi:MAG: FAD-binding oxidoreductase [Pseudomonadota bacterium]